MPIPAVVRAWRGLTGRRAPETAPIRGLPKTWVRLLHHLEVDLVVDVGASAGEYGRKLRLRGYDGPIVSFEPRASARQELERHASMLGPWRALPFALGEVDGPAVINVSGNPGSSSMLEMLDRHRRAFPTSAYVGCETVEMRRLDSVVDDIIGDARRPWLKLDVQGFELAVLRGAGDRLHDFCAIQLELSTVPLYAGGPLREEADRFLTDAGFALAGVVQGFSDPETGRMLQLDGLFVREDLLP